MGAHVILKITTSGGEEETSFVAPGETINLLLPRGLGLVDLVATGLKNPSLAEVLENPSVEIADRISHRNVVSIENQGGHEFQISGGPTLGTKTIDWQPLTIDSNFDMSAKINLLPIMVSHTPDAGDKIARFARNNKCILITSAVFGVAGAVVLPIALPLLGFGAGGVAAGAGIGALIKEDIIHTIPISRRIQNETKIEIIFKEFKNIESVTVVNGKDEDGNRELIFISTFGKSDKIYRYRFEFTKAENDFEIQVPQTSADNWREFVPLDYDKVYGQKLENIYVLKPCSQK